MDGAFPEGFYSTTNLRTEIRVNGRWTEVADLIIKGLNGAIGSKKVTYDFARMMEGAKEIKCSEFGENIIAHM